MNIDWSPLTMRNQIYIQVFYFISYVEKCAESKIFKYLRFQKAHASQFRLMGLGICFKF